MSETEARETRFVSSKHIYLSEQMLNKIYNNVLESITINTIWYLTNFKEYFPI